MAPGKKNSKKRKSVFQNVIPQNINQEEIEKIKRLMEGMCALLKQIDSQPRNRLKLIGRKPPLKSILEDPVSVYHFGGLPGLLNIFHATRVFTSVETRNVLIDATQRNLSISNIENLQTSAKGSLNAFMESELNSFKIVVTEVIQVKEIEKVLLKAIGKMEDISKELSSSLGVSTIWPQKPFPKTISNIRETDIRANFDRMFLSQIVQIIKYIAPPNFTFSGEFKIKDTEFNVHPNISFSVTPDIFWEVIDGEDSKGIILMDVERGSLRNIMTNLSKVNDSAVILSDRDKEFLPEDHDLNSETTWEGVLKQAFAYLTLSMMNQIIISNGIEYFLLELADEQRDPYKIGNLEIPTIGIKVLSINVLSNPNISAQNLILYHALFGVNTDSEVAKNRLKIAKKVNYSVLGSSISNFEHQHFNIKITGKENEPSEDYIDIDNKIDDSVLKHLGFKIEEDSIKIKNFHRRFTNEQLDEMKSLQVGNGYNSAVYCLNHDNIKKYFENFLNSDTSTKYVLKIFDLIQMYNHIEDTYGHKLESPYLQKIYDEVKEISEKTFSTELKVHQAIQKYNSGADTENLIRIPKIYCVGKIDIKILIRTDPQIYWPLHQGDYLVLNHIVNKPSKISEFTLQDGLRQLKLLIKLGFFHDLCARNIRIGENSELYFIDLSSFKVISDTAHLDFCLKTTENNLRRSLEDLKKLEDDV